MSTYLVAYTSKTGTTKEIAERIVQCLEEANIKAEAKTLSEVTDLSSYDKIVLGSPINGMRLLPDFKDFLKKHESEKDKFIALYAVSIIHGNGRNFWTKAIQKDVDTVSTELGISNTAVFGGKSESAMPGFARFIFGLPKDLSNDLRDWNQIEHWAETLAAS
jgi:menaquinone-dependent protoporphyrinogen IX oxidase